MVDVMRSFAPGRAAGHTRSWHQPSGPWQFDKGAYATLARMLLTITTTRAPATDLGHLLHKHPDRLQSFELPFGQAHVFYPEASEERCTAALLLDVDPVGLIRRGVRFPRLDQYVNDRPYVASSFLSVSWARVYNS